MTSGHICVHTQVLLCVSACGDVLSVCPATLQRLTNLSVTLVVCVYTGLHIQDLWYLMYCWSFAYRHSPSCMLYEVLICDPSCSPEAPVGSGIRRAEWCWLGRLRRSGHTQVGHPVLPGT